MKTIKRRKKKVSAPPTERYLNSKPPVGGTGDTPPTPPEEESGDHKPNPHPFDAFWMGCYSGPLGFEQVSWDDICKWMEEMTDWVLSNGWGFCDRYPHRFYVINFDPVTKKRIDLSRRDFFRVVAKFKEVNEKYGLCLSGSLMYNKDPSAPRHESCSEHFFRGQHILGDSIGRPLHSKLPSRKNRQ